jgi:hypothetical protein
MKLKIDMDTSEQLSRFFSSVFLLGEIVILVSLTAMRSDETGTTAPLCLSTESFISESERAIFFLYLFNTCI